MSTTSTYQITGTFTGADQIIGKFRDMEKAIKDIERAMKEVASASSQMNRQSSAGSGQRIRQHKEEATALQKLAEAGHRYRTIMSETRQVMSDFRQTFEPLVDGARRLGVAQAQFKALGLGEQESIRAFNAVEKVVKEIGGVRTSSAVSDLISLKSAVGDLGTAIELLPTIEKTRFTFQALFEADPKALERDIYDTLKALEQLGAVRQLPGGTFDVERFKQFLDVAIRAKAYTRGALSGSQLKSFAQTSGAAGMQLEPEGLLNLISVMEAMGGGQVGTALMSQINSFVAFRQGAGGQRSFENMARLGLIDFQKAQREQLIEFTKEGRIKRMRPGAVPIADLLGKDPLMFADAMAEAIRKHGEKVVKKSPGMSEEEFLTRVLTQITGSRTSMNLLAKMILLRENIRKDYEAMRRSMGSEQLFSLASKEDIGNVVKFTEKLEDFKEKVGLPLLSILSDLADAAAPFIEFLKNHPLLSFWGLAGSKATFELLKLLGVLRQFQAANVIINAGAGAAGAGAAGAGAGAGIRGLLAGGAGALAGGAKALAGRVSGAALGGVIGAIGLGMLIDEWFASSDAEARAAAAGETLGQLFAERFKAYTGDMLKEFDQANADMIAKQIAEIQHLGEVHQDFISKWMGWGKGAPWGEFQQELNRYALTDREDERKRVGNKLKDKLYYSGISSPEILAAYLKQAEERLRASGRSDLIAPLEKLARETFPMWEGELNKLRGLGPAAESAAEALRRLANDIPTGNFFAPRQRPSEFNFGGFGPSKMIPTANFPGHDAGGLTRRDHLALVHANEFIIPRSEAMAYFASAVGGQGGGLPPINMTIDARVYAGQGADPAAIGRAQYEAFRNAKHELERMLNIIMKERAPGR